MHSWEGDLTYRPQRMRFGAFIAPFHKLGDNPTLMLNAPVPAAKKVLAQAGLTVADIDLFEINEAFAVQVLACARDLGLSMEQLNRRGGAIALGHPIGCSGARVLVTLLHLMEDKHCRRGIASLCIGGGMGIALGLQLVS